jgi:regulator of sirC expression with transglutaminase-like and TPR domain
MSLEAFAQAVAHEERINLAQTCLMIAQDAYPTLEVTHYLDEIERMSQDVRSQLPRGAAAEERIAALNEFLFEQLGFCGNTDDYYDPRNSYLNEVIDRKTGIPITLSVLYIEIGRRVGLPLEGVSFPGHFLVRVQVRGGVLVLDPFSGGLAQSEADLRCRLSRVIPEGVAADMPVSQLPLDQFLEPASKREILVRVAAQSEGDLSGVRQTRAPARGAEPHAVARPGGDYGAARSRLCLSAPGVLASGAEGPHRIPRTRARRAGSRRCARSHDGAQSAVRPDELIKPL